MARMTGSDCAVMCNLINTHTHRMTRMTGADCAVMFNLINTHTHTHSHIPRLSTPGDLVEGTQEGQSTYSSGGIPVECVGFLPASSTGTRGPGIVCTGVQREPTQVEPSGA